MTFKYLAKRKKELTRYLVIVRVLNTVHAGQGAGLVHAAQQRVVTRAARVEVSIHHSFIGVNISQLTYYLMVI